MFKKGIKKDTYVICLGIFIIFEYNGLTLLTHH